MATVQPSNNCELQLYQVLQRANLLKYFDTFITQGGDDVQQLCEAGEDEFLEIMALVGMASKPLHVRRLQKALQEWVANPEAFKVVKKCPTHVMSMNGSAPHNVSPVHTMEWSNNIQDYKVTPPQSSAISTSTPWRSQTRDISPSDGSNVDDHSSSDSHQGDFKDTMKDYLYFQSDQPYSSLMGMHQSILLEHQISAIATAAAMLAQDLPPFEPKSMPKKQISQEIEVVMQMSPDDSSRMNALRKYAAIYGRFDSKRKNDRPMTLHEISVNEASAQLCSHFPALLTRREELFPLARQVVRNSGYQYSKGHSRAAEVLVQPKLEQGEAVPANSTLILMSHEDSLSDLQAELNQITHELSEIVKEQDCIRSALRVLLEAKDHEQMKRLTAEMDILNDKQSAMTKRKQRIVNKINKHRKGSSKCSLTEDSQTESTFLEPTVRGPQMTKFVNSCGNYSSKGCYGDSEEILPSNHLSCLYKTAIQNHKDSLFEEGLRIATQYGMSDFAKELIGMKSTRGDIVNKTESEIYESSECANITGFMPHSSTSPFSTSFSGANTSLTKHSIPGSSKGVCPFPSPASPDASSEKRVLDISRSSEDTSTEAAKLVPADSNICHIHSYKHNFHSFESSGLCADGLVHTAAAQSTDPATKISHQNIHSITGDSTIIECSIKTSTISKSIAAKFDNVMEVEAQCSNRRRSGNTDCYLNIGGEKQEKRFCSENSRWNSSTSNEHTMRLSSTSTLSPSTPLSTSI